MKPLPMLLAIIALILALVLLLGPCVLTITPPRPTGPEVADDTGGGSSGQDGAT